MSSRIVDVQEPIAIGCDPSINSGQAATQLPNSEQKFEWSVAREAEENYWSW